MSDASAPDDRLSELLRLAAQLSDEILDARIEKRAVPDEQVRALADAATVLREHAIPLPPLMTQALHEIGESAGDRAAHGTPAGGRLSRLLGSFRKG